MDPLGTPANGAAFVLISHGENQSGAFSSGGTLLPASNAQEGTDEAPNRADQAILAVYIDASKRYENTANHFDDLISRPSVMTVINRALLGPRAHY